MEWPVLPYTMIPFRIPPPLILQPPPCDDELPMDLSIGKNKLPVTPPPTPDTPLSPDSGCQSPHFGRFVGRPMSPFNVVPSREHERSYDCVDCNYTTRRRTNLKRHIQSMHSRQEMVECCGQKFFSKAEFRTHVKQVHQNGYKCQLCDRAFCRKALLKRHMSVHNGIKEFNCSLCQYATSHKSNLERHQRVHNRQNNLINFQDVAAAGTKIKYDQPSSPRGGAPPSSPSLMSITSDVTEEGNEEIPFEGFTSSDETPEILSEDPEAGDRPINMIKVEPETCNDRLLALRVATEEVLAMQETSKMMPGSQRMYTWPYKCVQCAQKFKTQQALTLHEIQIHPNRRADAFLSFPLKYQLKIVYNAFAQARDGSKD